MLLKPLFINWPYIIQSFQGNLVIIISCFLICIISPQNGLEISEGWVATRNRLNFEKLRRSLSNKLPHPRIMLNPNFQLFRKDLQFSKIGSLRGQYPNLPQFSAKSGRFHRKTIVPLNSSSLNCVVYQFSVQLDKH